MKYSVYRANDDQDNPWVYEPADDADLDKGCYGFSDTMRDAFLMASVLAEHGGVWPVDIQSEIEEWLGYELEPYVGS